MDNDVFLTLHSVYVQLQYLDNFDFFLAIS